jgi:hypothetical protein
VNFFGHACVASWFDAGPGFVLGAMVPDFFSMIGLKPVRARDPSLAAGIELHHLTDAAFHSAEPFISLTHAARVALSEAGLARGPARAVAHIGVEILLDEVLAREMRGLNAYLAALAIGESARELLEFQSTEHADRCLSLLGVLATRGAPDASVPAAQVADRIQRALRGRPRLCLDERGHARVSDWVVAARPDVVGSSSALLAVLRTRLNPPGSALVP